MEQSPEERSHWRSVIKAFDGYMQYHLSANHARRMAFLSLPKETRLVYEQLGYREKLEAVDEGIRRNAEFIDEIIADPVFADMMKEPASSSNDHTHGEHTHDAHDHGNEHSHSHSHNHDHHSHGSHSQTSGESSSRSGERDAAQEKVRSTLRSFVRDWSIEGADERKKCYDPCLEVLEKHYPKGKGKERGEIRVLVPGCGLGRLAMEIAARGFASQGNEFSTYMLLASYFVLNQTTHANSHAVHPFLHSFSNHTSTENMLRRVLIPDICPADVLGEGQGGAFSLVAGDFEEIYGTEHWDSSNSGVPDEEKGQRGKWGAVVTCFFLDCARNVLSYLKIIHALLDDGGIWINIGPLLWHFENSPSTSSKGEGSIELSLEEVKQLARTVGFEIHDERTISTTYTGIPGGMLKHEYQAAFWTATKRNQ